jgi:guanylate kinase
MPTGALIFISGPSGVGKSTVCLRLSQELPAEFALSATTRQSKAQDRYGKRYEFVDEAEFKRRIEKGDFLEYANVFGNWYGTLRRPVEAALGAGRLVLLEIDVHGGRQIAAAFPDALGVFIMPPSLDELRRRLELRGRDEPTVIRRRLDEAQREMEFARSADVYRHMVVNENLDQTVYDISAFIREAQRARMSACPSDPMK